MRTTIYFLFLFLLGILFSVPSYGQKINKDTLLRVAKIQHIATNNKVQFTADTPQLRQIAGAPKAFYTYFWEFGDGHYSTDNNPKHTYKNKGEYTTRLIATNNYDDGPPPTSRPKKVNITDVSSTDYVDENRNLIDKHHGFRLLNNREPSPNQEMQVVMSYANTKDYTTQGKLYVFFNEKKFKNKNFNLVDTRTYYGEIKKEEKLDLAFQKQMSYNNFVLTTGIQTLYNSFVEETDTLIKHNLPATLKKAKETYQDYSVWEFDNLQANEKRNLFLSFKTTPEMLKDTTAIISIRSIFVPEQGNDAHQIRTKEMEIVTSHDPNKMAVYNTRINYRFMRFKRLKYKVRFQNNGEGPASLIKLNVEVPKMLDKSTLKVLDMYPKVPICPDGETVQYSCLDTVRIKEGISFQFKNIYLPGSNQKGVHEKDSTKGFVKYAMKFGKKFHKIRSRSKTVIIFDKNEPIITNTASSRFSTGLSIGVRAGYNYFLTKDKGESLEIPNIIPAGNSLTVIKQSKGHSYFTGLTFSPYKSYRWYFQAETYLDKKLFETDYTIKYLQRVTYETTNADGEVVEESILAHVKQTYNKETTQTNLFVVPASVRYNINSIIGLGAGVQLNLRMNGTTDESIQKEYYTFNENQPEELGDELEFLFSKKKDITEFGWELYDYMPYIDMTIGASRIGPSLGVRYLYPIKQKQQILQFYAIWKF